MWQRFTKEARSAILSAQKCAMKLSYIHVDTEHILLALLLQEQTMAGQILKQKGIVYDEVVKKLPHYPSLNELYPKAPPLTPGSRKVLEWSAREARELQCDCIDTPHLLLGLLHVQDGRAAAILREYGIELDSLRAQVKQMLKEEREAQATEIDQAVSEMLRELGPDQ